MDRRISQSQMNTMMLAAAMRYHGFITDEDIQAAKGISGLLKGVDLSVPIRQCRSVPGEPGVYSATVTIPDSFQ